MKISNISKIFYRLVKDISTEECYISCTDHNGSHVSDYNFIKIRFKTIEYIIDLENNEMVITSTTGGGSAMINPNNSDECQDWNHGIIITKELISKLSLDSNRDLKKLKDMGY